jgi:hypothetical protein
MLSGFVTWDTIALAPNWMRKEDIFSVQGLNARGNCKGVTLEYNPLPWFAKI